LRKNNSGHPSNPHYLTSDSGNSYKDINKKRPEYWGVFFLVCLKFRLQQLWTPIKPTIVDTHQTHIKKEVMFGRPDNSENPGGEA
jgi:hypothetical protein